MVEIAEYIIESISQNPEGFAWAATVGGPAAIGGAVYGTIYSIETVSDFISGSDDEELSPDLLEEDPERDGISDLDYEDEY